MRRTVLFSVLAIGSAAIADTCDPAVVFQFNPGLGTLVGAAYDQAADAVWAVDDFASSINRYSREGVFLSTVPTFGGASDDADIDVATESLMMGSTPIPAGTLLYTNGESGVAEIYAIDPASGALLATLTTAFGVSHVVGCSYHPGRNTFFLVQDRVPSGDANDNLIAEIDPADGSVLNSFKTTDALASFSVFFGDIEVGPGGTLMVVSSDETSILVLTPTGEYVRDIPYPSGPSSISGIGIDAGRGEAWISGSGGTLWRLLLAECPADLNCDGVLNIFDFLAFQSAFSNGEPLGDFDGNSSLNVFDFLAFQSAFGNGC